jgi:hypothetical protein
MIQGREGEEGSTRPEAAGIWHLASGIWNLASGIRDLGLGIRHSARHPRQAEWRRA